PCAKLHCRANLHMARVPDSAALCGNPFIASAGTSIFGIVVPTKMRPSTAPVWSRGNSGPVVRNAPQTATRNGAKFEDRTHACNAALSAVIAHVKVLLN